MDEKEEKMNKKLESLLQLANKAAKLSYGFDATERSCRNGKASLVLLAKDLGNSSLKGFLNISSANNVAIKKIGTKKDFGRILNRREVGIISVNDKNFADGILKLLINLEE
jgi:ribosomal protein L7Ae-like RNA K-turn-binding protein